MITGGMVNYLRGGKVHILYLKQESPAVWFPLCKGKARLRRFMVPIDGSPPATCKKCLKFYNEGKPPGK